VNIEETLVVADVVDGVEASALKVQPGDKVIFENTN
jgi:plastocyanin